MEKNVKVCKDGRLVIKKLHFPNYCSFSSDDIVVLPGFVDVHVHFRQPGFSYKETIASGTAAAKAGGYTAVCTMPNLSPVPDNRENLDVQLRLIEQGACVDVYPYGSITVGQRGEVLSDMEALAPYVVAFSDDGKGVKDDKMMYDAMVKAGSLGKLIAAHCEDETLLDGGYIHKGKYAALHGHRGICSESEWRQLERDLSLVRRTGVSYHMCHVSAKESVALIRRAKKEGLDVSCETAPHYLTLNDEMLCDDGRFKMNPPIRSEEDRQALIEGILDGTIDMIATDHAPHSRQEKAGGLKNSLMGVVGLETAFPVLYTCLVKNGIISLEKLVSLMSDNPARRFGLPQRGYTVFDLGHSYELCPEEFASQGRATPFAGRTVWAKCITTEMGDIDYAQGV